MKSEWPYINITADARRLLKSWLKLHEAARADQNLSDLLDLHARMAQALGGGKDLTELRARAMYRLNLEKKHGEADKTIARLRYATGGRA